MAIVKPFKALRPAVQYAKDVAALPYDVYDREEAKAYVKDKPLSFLNIDRPETQFDDNHDMYGDDVYDKACLVPKKVYDEYYSYGTGSVK